jgi:hypothetical protein
MKQYGDSWIMGKPTQEGIYWVWDNVDNEAKLIKVQKDDSDNNLYYMEFEWEVDSPLKYLKDVTHHQLVDPPQKPR